MYTFYDLARPVTVTSLCHCFSPTYSESFYFDGERHDFWECVFVTEGVVGVAEDEKIYRLSQNEIIFHKPREFHRIWAAEGTKPSLIILSFRAEGVGLERLSEGVFLLTKEMRSHMLSAAQEAEAALALGKPWRKNVISQQMLACTIETVMLLILQRAKSSISETETIAARHYKSIVRAMNENIDKSLNIAQLAKLTRMGEANLKKCFKKYSGMGVMAYFMSLKMRRAVELMKEGYTIREISEALGFATQNYFSTAFKREFGLTPLAYKRALE
ncbi:MAG: helix-turn-helix transcriptional regulator [Clostridia bacterium]|nr:helix-turn-helix transcriptional regulator [Clostridia bacterium]